MIGTHSFINSDTWLHMKPEIAKMIEAARDALEQPQTEDETQRLRGEIRAYRAVISLVESDITPQSSAASDYLTT